MRITNKLLNSLVLSINEKIKRIRRWWKSGGVGDGFDGWGR